MGSEKIVDLRSDTVTRPTAGMLKAMFGAEVGDDVFGDDPTVNRLEEVGAAYLGQEKALFTPTGTMANQIALRCWTRPGDEVIADAGAHIYNNEVGAAAALSGLSIRPLATDNGILQPEQVEEAIRPPENIHCPRTRIIAIENTHNRAGGSVYPLGRVEDLRALAERRGLVLHMDGARLCNAAVATGLRCSDYGRLCHSLTLCLSKGLGCPVGSLVAGPADFIKTARRARKMMGGGMRQAGYLAAAGLYALEHNVERLAEDHANARRLADGLAEIAELEVDVKRVATNMVYYRFRQGRERAAAVADLCKAEGVLIGLMGRSDTVRSVTHLDVSRQDVDRTVATVKKQCGR